MRKPKRRFFFWYGEVWHKYNGYIAIWTRLGQCLTDACGLLRVFAGLFLILDHVDGFWDRFGIDLWSIRNRLGTDLGLASDRLGSICGQFGKSLGPMHDRFGTDSDAFGIDLGWSHSGLKNIYDRYWSNQDQCGNAFSVLLGVISVPFVTHLGSTMDRFGIRPRTTILTPCRPHLLHGCQK